MANYLKQSTAHTFQLGPFVDSTDGFTPENLLTIAYTDVYVSKAGAALAAKNDNTNLTGTGDSLGYYDCVLNTTDTGTLGNLRVHCYVSGALPVWVDFTVLPANVYDSLVAGSDLLQIDMTQIGGNSCTSGNVATLNLKQLDIQNSAGTAVIAKSTGSNGKGVDVAGNGSGIGLNIVGGTTASGAEISGGYDGLRCTSGNGVNSVNGAVFTGGNGATTAGILVQTTGSGASHAVSILANSSGHGIKSTGGSTGSGAVFTSGTGATGDGVQMTAASTNGYGLAMTGTGTQSGLYAIGGTTGSGAEFKTGSSATSADGALLLTAQNTANGLYSIGSGATGAGARFTSGSGSSTGAVWIEGSGTGTVHGLRIDGAGAGSGISAQGGSTGVGGTGISVAAGGTSGHAILAQGAGDKNGIYAIGGATGNGMKLVGGATSGAGLKVEGTNGNADGATFTAHGTGVDLNADNVGGATAAAVADAVLEELVADHSGVAGSLAATVAAGSPTNTGTIA